MEERAFSPLEKTMLEEVENKEASREVVGSEEKSLETLVLRQVSFLKDLVHGINVSVERAIGRNPNYRLFLMNGGGYFLWSEEKWRAEHLSYPLNQIVRWFLVHEGYYGVHVAPSETFLDLNEVRKVTKEIFSLSPEPPEEEELEKDLIIQVSSYFLNRLPLSFKEKFRELEIYDYDPKEKVLSILANLKDKRRRSLRREASERLSNYLDGLDIKVVVEIGY